MLNFKIIHVWKSKDILWKLEINGKKSLKIFVYKFEILIHGALVYYHDQWFLVIDSFNLYI